MTALAAEVRFSTRTGRSHPSPQLHSAQTIGKTYLSGPHECECGVARLNPCPSFINTTRKLVTLQTAPINSSNLILFPRAPSKAINKLRRLQNESRRDD